eukprot:3408211-Lingulodinium_polyedra.AAC.1
MARPAPQKRTLPPFAAPPGKRAANSALARSPACARWVAVLPACQKSWPGCYATTARELPSSP